MNTTISVWAEEPVLRRIPLGELVWDVLDGYIRTIITEKQKELRENGHRLHRVFLYAHPKITLDGYAKPRLYVCLERVDMPDGKVDWRRVR